MPVRVLLVYIYENYKTMPKIKLTKGELKRQRDSLQQFRHYLPTLQLKKQQLQIKIMEERKLLIERERVLENKVSSIMQWCGLLADPEIDIKEWIEPEDVLAEEINIAGANVPVFKEVLFRQAEYDFYSTPLWVDKGIKSLREAITLKVETEIIKKKIEILANELRITSQRVNLFEKVKIPGGVDNIRRIRIYLGDQMANAVGIGKVAKKKIEAAGCAV